MRGCRRRGFSLVEMMVVIVILMILLALLVPFMGQAYDYYDEAQCQWRLHEIWKSLHIGQVASLPDPHNWTESVRGAGAEEMLRCPRDNSTAVEVALRSCTGNNVDQIDPPASVVFNDLESNTTIQMFCEREHYVLPTDVDVNLSTPGTYGSFGGGGGSIPAGTVVNCYFLHFDPVGSGPAETRGSVNFGSKMLGVIVTDAQLDKTDAVLGIPGTRYPGGQKSRGFESGAENVTLSDDRTTFVINRFTSTFPGEQVRVLTVSEAGASSYGMNIQVRPSGPRPSQILLVEYGRTTVDLDGKDSDDDFEALVRPRHQGRVNVLMVEGNVESLEPDELRPAPSGMDRWKP